MTAWRSQQPEDRGTWQQALDSRQEVMKRFVVLLLYFLGGKALLPTQGAGQAKTHRRKLLGVSCQSCYSPNTALQEMIVRQE